MEKERLPLDFGNIPLGSLYEDRLVEDLLLLVEVVSACQEGDDARLAELGVRASVPVGSQQSPSGWHRRVSATKNRIEVRGGTTPEWGRGAGP